MIRLPIVHRPTTRRGFAGLCLASATLMSASRNARSQTAKRRLRLLLNTGFSSPQAWLWIALARGYLAAEELELEISPGAGAYTAAPRMVQEKYDLAYGDVNSLIEVCARRPEGAPRGVYMMFNASPSCVMVAAERPIRHPNHLLGRRVVGHGSDVALRTFGALCQHLNLESKRVSVVEAWTDMVGMAEDVLAARSAGAFGYVSTFTGALTAADPALLNKVRFLRFADYATDLYGSVVMASQRLLHDEPELVSRVVRALNRGVVTMLRDPEAGLEAVLRSVPGLNRSAEAARLRSTLQLEMNPDLPSGVRRMDLGDVDASRLDRSIALMASGSGLPRKPAATEIFTWAHLPPASERERP